MSNFQENLIYFILGMLTICGIVFVVAAYITWKEHRKRMTSLQEITKNWKEISREFNKTDIPEA